MSKAWVTKPLGMFTGADQTENFRSLASIFPCRVIRRAERPYRFERGTTLQLPPTYVHEGERRSSAELLASTETAGLLVLRRGALVYEKYWCGLARSRQWALWSISKSWVSALIGSALAEGAIGSLDDRVIDYVPRLAGSAYDGATIKHVLQMSSGARWDEAYWDAESDIREAGRALALGGARSEVAASLRREFEPGSYHRYSSIDTHVLGMVLQRATRSSLSDYLRAKLWSALGAESDAFWIIEGDGREWAAAGLNATLRDVAKLGLLYAQDGVWNGRQLLPETWIRASITADAQHLRPGTREGSASPYGYGYQWWLPDDSGSYCAMGIYNQFVYVDPEREVVVVKLSANRHYASSGELSSFREPEHFAFFRALVHRCG
jgi:CubicO group peptidase (beta-lactamase class C family)